MEVLSNNLANVDTPAFKRDLAVFQARFAEETSRGQDRPGSGSINDVGGGVWMSGTITDFSQGTLKTTNHPTDVAINGDGFFVIDQHGKPYLTRAGNFMVNDLGELITQSGDHVMSEEDTPLVINPDTPWRISPDGALEQDGDKTFLKMVQPRHLSDMVKQGENMYRSLGPVEPLEEEARHVVSGHLEMSGVRPTLEMLDLIETSRVFEANITMIRNHDSMLNSLVNRVLRQS